MRKGLLANMLRLSRLPVGVQVKAVVITSFLVLTMATAGGWLYFSSARTLMRYADLRQAEDQAHSLALIVAQPLARTDATVVRRIVSDLASTPTLRFVGVVDASGRIVASASRTGEATLWRGLCAVPVAVMASQALPRDVLTVCRPVLGGQGERADQVAGGVRLVFDTRGTSVRLGRMQRRVLTIAAAMVVALVPLGYLMVWRVMVQPLRRMVQTVRRVSEGDFDARTHLVRNDETGELARALDTMVEEIGRSRRRLMRMNEELEQRIAQRTAELRRANDRLRREMAEKEDFLRVVSHDLSAPLRNIAGMASTLLAKHGDALPADAVNRLGRIQANVDSETELIGELLEFSRLKARLDKRERVDVQDLVAELTQTFDYDLRNRGVQLRVRGRLPVMYAERISVKKVFQNLIDNAIKYMDKPSGGLIEIGCVQAGDLLHFSVSDNGPGIAQQDQERIFCIFRRAENAQTARIPGKGVGLATVKAVATHYGGNAWVTSKLGEGTTFHMTFGPICQVPQMTSQEQASQVPAAAATTS
jgi:signal transduction histidine kinase